MKDVEFKVNDRVHCSFWNDDGIITEINNNLKFPIIVRLDKFKEFPEMHNKATYTNNGSYHIDDKIIHLTKI